MFGSRVAVLAEGQYITRELNIPLYCPTQKECNNRFIMTQIWWGKIMGKRGKKRGERERAGVAGEARTRAPSLVKTALKPIGLPRLERKASSKRAYNCHGNQENAKLQGNTASYCPPIDQSDCNMTSSHIINKTYYISQREIWRV